MSDFFVGGGLETRILEQVRVYQGHGINCYLVADKYNAELVKAFKGFLNLPLMSHDRETIVENVDMLVDFCREKKIEMIDVQPLYSLITAGFASAILHIPISYTMHGRYSLPPADDSLLTWFHLALELRKPQIVLVAEYLEGVYPELLTGKDLTVVRNGIAPIGTIVRKTSEHKWIFASRLSKEKTSLLLNALPVLEEAGIEQLDVFGGGEEEEHVKSAIKTFNANTKHKMNVVFCGWCESIPNKILDGDYEGGIGMDRVAEEMIMTGLPVMILGYGGLAEGVSAQNFDELMKNNFTSWKRIPKIEAVKALRQIQQNPKKYNVQRLAQKKIDSVKIWEQRLEEIRTLKTDLGRDSMIETVWRDFYENVRRAQAIEMLRARLDKTVEGRLYRQIRRVLPGKGN